MSSRSTTICRTKGLSSVAIGLRPGRSNGATTWIDSTPESLGGRGSAKAAVSMPKAPIADTRTVVGERRFVGTLLLGSSCVICVRISALWRGRNQPPV